VSERSRETANRRGIDSRRVFLAREDWIALGLQARGMPVPAAHPRVETDDEGYLRCVGYVIEYEGRRLYHGGDGSLTISFLTD